MTRDVGGLCVSSRLNQIPSPHVDGIGTRLRVIYLSARRSLSAALNDQNWYVYRHVVSLFIPVNHVIDVIAWLARLVTLNLQLSDLSDLSLLYLLTLRM